MQVLFFPIILKSIVYKDYNHYAIQGEIENTSVGKYFHKVIDTFLNKEFSCPWWCFELSVQKKERKTAC